MKRTIRALIVFAGCVATGIAGAADPGNHEGATKSDVARVTAPQFSPYAGRNYPTRVFWGDTHLHTSISVDAGTMNRVGQEDAFRFARGEGMWYDAGLVYLAVLVGFCLDAGERRDLGALFAELRAARARRG